MAAPYHSSTVVGPLLLACSAVPWLNKGRLTRDSNATRAMQTVHVLFITNPPYEFPKHI
jgi:hypothetical protein